MKTRLGALNAKRTIKSDSQWRTLQFLLGLPELLQLREVLVQYEDLGEAQGGHLRRSRLVIGQNFLRLTLTLSQLILFPFFLFNFSFASYHQLRSGMGMNRISQIIRTSHQLPVHRVLGTLITALAHLPSVFSHLFPRLLRLKKKIEKKTLKTGQITSHLLQILLFTAVDTGYRARNEKFTYIDHKNELEKPYWKPRNRSNQSVFPVEPENARVY